MKRATRVALSGGEGELHLITDEERADILDSDARQAAEVKRLKAWATGKFAVCTCPRCYGSAHLSSYDCPRAAALRPAKARK